MSISLAEKDKLRKDFNKYRKREALTQLIKERLIPIDTIFGGEATSREMINADDIFEGSMLAKMIYPLICKKEDKEKKNETNYVCLIHPFQLYDLMNDADWIASSRYESSKKTFRSYVGTYPYMDIDVFRSYDIPIITEGVKPKVKVYRTIGLEISSGWENILKMDWDTYIHLQILTAEEVVFIETSSSFVPKNK